MGRYNPFTESEYDIIYSMKFLAEQSSDHVALGMQLPEETPSEPEGDCKAQNGDDMTGKYLMKIVTELAAQTQSLRELFNAINSLTPALLTDMQALRTSHAMTKNSIDRLRAAVVGCIQDTSKEACSDLKDNVNANADMLHRKLDEIKINTRKKGL